MGARQAWKEKTGEDVSINSASKEAWERIGASLGEDIYNGKFPLIPLQRKRGSLKEFFRMTSFHMVSINSASKEAWEGRGKTHLPCRGRVFPLWNY